MTKPVEKIGDPQAYIVFQTLTLALVTSITLTCAGNLALNFSEIFSTQLTSGFGKEVT
jgi:hypothetical protein